MNRKIKTIDALTRKRIFGLYAGQKIMSTDSFGETDYFEEPILSIAKYPGLFLKVTPLWQISYEDAQEAIRHVFPPLRSNYEKVFKVKADFHLKKVHFKILIKEVVYQGDIDFFTGNVDIDEDYYFRNSNLDYINYFDSLRSMGYALPAFGWSVQELYDQNVFWWQDIMQEDGATQLMNRRI